MAAKHSLTFTEDDLKPVLYHHLTPQQIASMEGVCKRTVNTWIAEGKFDEYSVHPGGGNRVPIWAYIQFRRERAIRG